MSFSSPLLLLLLVAVPGLLLLWARAERVRAERLRALVDARLVDAGLVQGVSDARRVAKRGSLVFGFALLVVAAAGPQVGGQTVLLPQKGLDILFVVDVSRSMRARDVLPDRLERAKAEIGALLPRLHGQRVGLIAFAGTAFVQCPLTTDVEALRLFLRDLAPDSVPQGGTNLAAGLEVALNSIVAEKEGQGSASAGRLIVVVTDGEDHQGGLDTVAGRLKDEGTSTIFVGVGSTLGEPIPVTDKAEAVTGYLKDKGGQTVMTRMSPEVLSDVAQKLGGTFIDGTNQPELGLREVEARVQSMAKRDLESRLHTEHVDRSPAVAAVALFLSLFAWVLPERARRHA